MNPLILGSCWLLLCQHFPDPVQASDLERFPSLELVCRQSLYYEAYGEYLRARQGLQPTLSYWSRLGDQNRKCCEVWSSLNRAHTAYAPGDKIQYLAELKAQLGPEAYLLGYLPWFPDSLKVYLPEYALREPETMMPP